MICFKENDKLLRRFFGNGLSLVYLKALTESLSSCFDLGRELRKYSQVQGEAHSLCRESDEERHSYIISTSG